MNNRRMIIDEDLLYAMPDTADRVRFIVGALRMAGFRDDLTLVVDRDHKKEQLLFYQERSDRPYGPSPGLLMSRVSTLIESVQKVGAPQMHGIHYPISSTRGMA